MKAAGGCAVKLSTIHVTTTTTTLLNTAYGWWHSTRAYLQQQRRETLLGIFPNQVQVDLLFSVCNIIISDGWGSWEVTEESDEKKELVKLFTICFYQLKIFKNIARIYTNLLWLLNVIVELQSVYFFFSIQNVRIYYKNVTRSCWEVVRSCSPRQHLALLSARSPLLLSHHHRKPPPPPRLQMQHKFSFIDQQVARGRTHGAVVSTIQVEWFLPAV